MASSFVLGRSRAFATAISISNRQRPFTTPTTIGAALAPIESRRSAHRRRQTPPTGAAMKLFAYEHPSGPVHEVEVTLGDTAHWRRLRRSNASTRPRRRHARPPQVLQLKSKIEQAMRTSAWESNFRHATTRCPRVGSISHRGDFHTGPTRRSSRPRSSTSPSAARNWTTTRRRSRLLESRRTTRCAPSPSR